MLPVGYGQVRYPADELAHKDIADRAGLSHRDPQHPKFDTDLVQSGGVEHFGYAIDLAELRKRTRQASFYSAFLFISGVTYDLHTKWSGTEVR
jgi:hypothetical protein